MATALGCRLINKAASNQQLLRLFSIAFWCFLPPQVNYFEQHNSASTLDQGTTWREIQHFTAAAHRGNCKSTPPVTTRAYSASAHQAQTETTEIALGLRDQPTALAPARRFILTVTKSYRINKCSQDFLRNDIAQKQYKFRLRWRTPRRYSMRGACLYTSGQEDLPSNMPGISRYYKILQVGMQRAGLESIRQRVMSYDAAVHCISWYSTHLVIIQYRALRIFLQTFVHMCTTMYYIHILSISMISICIYTAYAWALPGTATTTGNASASSSSS